MSDHSLLAPSAAERWSRCVGALYLAKGLPDVDAEYNASGTCSHWLGQWALTNKDRKLDVWLGQEMEFQGFKFKIDAERLERVQAYVDGVNREPGQLWVEKLINTTPILGLPGQKGHADAVKLDILGQCVINEIPRTGVLTVHDFKDGYLLVKAKNNLQGLLYLAGALFEFDLMTEINALRFAIHQPRIGHYDEWTYTREEIEHFVTLIRPVAKLAYDLFYGNEQFDPAQHLNAGEEQCQWCPVRGSCPARAAHIVKMFEPLINRHKIDDDTLSQIYMRLDEIEGACRDFRGEALRRALMGHSIKDHKLVQGKRGPRRWTDKSKAETGLRFVLEEEQMWEPRELISPTAAEKLLKKKQFQALVPYVVQSEGSLSLVHTSDERAEVKIETFKPVEGQ